MTPRAPRRVSSKRKVQPSSPVLVIMAGGSGERFWPVSNSETPKQLLRLHGEKTLLEEAFDRAARLVPARDVFVVAGERLETKIRGALPRLSRANYIAEPIARNTAACLALAAVEIGRMRGPETPMGVLTADHVIEESREFKRAIFAGLAHAGEFERLVTIGIHPTAPDTAFGYIEMGEPIARQSTRFGTEPILQALRFKEKPPLSVAKRYLKTGRYGWNSGMFFWRARVFLEELAKFHPEFSLFLAASKAAARRAIFQRLPSLAVDTAVMERSSKVVVIRGRFAWQDVGSWDSICRLRPVDDHGNCAVGPALTLESSDNIVYNEMGQGDSPPVVLYGVKGLIVVRTDRAILVIPKSGAQKVKDVLRRLKESGRMELL